MTSRFTFVLLAFALLAANVMLAANDALAEDAGAPSSDSTKGGMATPGSSTTVGPAADSSGAATSGAVGKVMGRNGSDTGERTVGGQSGPAPKGPGDAGASNDASIGDPLGNARGHRPGASKDIASDANAIDTRITTLPGRAPMKKHAIDFKRLTVGSSPAANVRDHRQTSAPTVTGAIGAAVNSAAPARGAERTGRAAIDGTARNTIGAMAGHGATVGSAAINGAAITGTGMARPGSGPGSIGGPAKNVTGINGTAFKPRHYY